MPWALHGNTARGYAIGIGLGAAIGYLALAGLEAPRSCGQAAFGAQALLVLLALPACTPAFLDAPRVRFLAAMLGFATPIAALYLLVVAGDSDGAMSGCAIAASLALGVGLIGLARQKTWSLFALLGGAGLLALTPSLQDPLHVAELQPPAWLAWLGAGVIALGVAAWLGPLVRALRGKGTTSRA